MKKIFFSLLALTAFALSSCNDGEEGDQAYVMPVTVKKLDATEYYFELDSKKTIYPSNKTNLIYSPKDGQRAILLFSLQDQAVPGYDYNATIYKIEDIYTSIAEAMPVADMAQQTNDPIDIVDAVFIGDWLTFYVRHPFRSDSQQEHSYKLVFDEDAFEANSSYINLTLLHDAKGEAQEEDNTYNYISFSALSIDQYMNDKKGVKITYKSHTTMKSEEAKIERQNVN